MSRKIVKDREAWCAVVHGFTKSQTKLSNWTTIATTNSYVIFFCSESGLLWIIRPQKYEGGHGMWFLRGVKKGHCSLCSTFYPRLPTPRPLNFVLLSLLAPALCRGPGCLEDTDSDKSITRRPLPSIAGTSSFCLLKCIVHIDLIAVQTRSTKRQQTRVIEHLSKQGIIQKPALPILRSSLKSHLERE